MKIEVGGKYYFNNGQVTVLKFETNEMVLVEGNRDIHTELSGSQFCIQCMVGSAGGTPHSHECSDAQDIIDNVVEDISEKDIFWVNVKHLQEKPFEYTKWEKITSENNAICEQIRSNNETLSQLKSSISNNTITLQNINKDIEDKKLALDTMLSSISEQDKQKVVLDNIPEITLANSTMNISTKDVLRWINDSIVLQYLDAGGVDNWEWYGESMPKCEDVHEYIENEAIVMLASYRVK